ncbi:DUF3306 domain-containing protein [Methylibium petroleiphilum]|uniref:Proline rich protein n=1 Tax=Methylibium petroleiphilum (strain ATCC BAA-1232 / LMG 22953 / PM1) TaxID=420662 RepID=A2SEY7_METPP|nr:DUF3306 domain-containing protein [Methylibium petroleiphilum]ABM94126.1 proline rich protein [Methylibium petroleiphilum PM1]
MSDASDGFLSRWSRRKAAVKGGRLSPDEPLPTPTAALVEAPAAVAPALPVDPAADAEAAAAEPLPTLDDVAALRPGDEVSRFVARGVDEDVKRAAVKKLFTDPHYNVMDGLDIYIDDYSQPDPIPTAMLRQLNQARFMGLFAAEEAAEVQAETQARAAAQATATPAHPADAVPVAEASPSPFSPAEDAGAPAPAVAAVPHAPDEDPDLQLQPDDAAGRPGAATRAGTGGL